MSSADGGTTPGADGTPERDAPETAAPDPAPDAVTADAGDAPEQEAAAAEPAAPEAGAVEAGAAEAGAAEPADAEPAAAEPAEEEPAAPVDEVRQEMLDVIRRELGDDVVGSHIERDDLWVRVQPGAWRRAAEVCRDLLDCDYFCFLSGIDWMSNPNLSGERLWDPDAVGGEPAAAAGEAAGEGEEGTPPGGVLVERGYAGGDTRFQMLARLYSTRRHTGVTLKADLDDADPRVETWVPVYRGADWHERETWEMYGFEFDGHPGLRHLYLPTDFEGHPLRKDFPLLAREVKPWPGLVDKEPIPGEDDDAGGESEAS